MQHLTCYVPHIGIELRLSNNALSQCGDNATVSACHLQAHGVAACTVLLGRKDALSLVKDQERQAIVGIV